MTDIRARITAGELVVVLSHYDLGLIESVSRFRGGSRQSPKVLVVSDRGRFLLKRRAAGAGSGAATDGQTERVAFSHDVALRLIEHGFPVPELIRTRHEGQTVLRLGGHAYELFRFVDGERYDHRPRTAYEAGALLGRFHSIMHGWTPPRPAPAGTFHYRPQFAERLEAAREQLDDPRAAPILRALGELYTRAGAEAEALGVSQRPTQVIHGDWHPGNMIFRPAGPPTPGPGSPGLIAAVCDFDSTRIGPVLVDIANGTLQFAVLRRFSSPDDSRAGGAAHDPAAWRIALDPDLFAAFGAGVRASGSSALESDRDRRAVPWLMVEALIVEAVLPVAATGKFGRLKALPILALVERTSASIVAEQARLVALVGGT